MTMKISIILLVIYSFMLFGTSTSSSSLLVDAINFSGGKNLLYLAFHNSLNFIDENVIPTLIKDIFKSNPVVYCVDITKSSNVSSIFNEFIRRHHKKQKLFIVHGEEAINPASASKNNFLFGVFEPYYEIKNLVILLTWDRSLNSVTEEDWKEKLQESLNSDENYVNGRAIVGRISSAFFDDGPPFTGNRIQYSSHCSKINNDNMISSTPATIATIFRENLPYMIAATFAVVAAAAFYMRPGPGSAAAARQIEDENHRMKMKPMDPNTSPVMTSIASANEGKVRSRRETPQSDEHTRRSERLKLQTSSILQLRR